MYRLASAADNLRCIQQAVPLTAIAGVQRDSRSSEETERGIARIGDLRWREAQSVVVDRLSITGIVNPVGSSWPF